MDFHVAIADRRDLSGQVYRQIRAAILNGQLRPGDPLPPTRELAGRLEISRNTVTVAYERLAAEGFLTGRVGAGTYVSTDLPEACAPDTPRPPGVGDLPPVLEPVLEPLPMWRQIPVPATGNASYQPAFDFRPGLPDARLFPYQTWRRLVSEQFRASVASTSRYGNPAGHPDLRAAIARHIGVSRGVRTGPEHVLVTNGVQQAVYLAARAMLPPAACVAVEDPGYPPPYRLFQSLGARIVRVPVDASGLVVDALPDDARLVYVTPSHQYPLGVSMSLARRMALLEWARKRRAVVLEDDYDTEFRFGGRPLEPLHALDRAGVVVYLGSFSKVLLPSLRLGFAVAPPDLHQAMCAARYVADWHTPVPTQAALAQFINEGRLARHIRRMRQEYRERHLRVAAAVTEIDQLTLVPSAAGLHLSAYLPPGIDAAAVVAAARKADVAVYATQDRADDPASRALLVFGYGAIPTARIPEGLVRLRSCLPHRDLPHRDLPHRDLPHRDLPHRDLPHRDLPHRDLPRL